MMPPRASAPYSSVRRSSAPPIPADWQSGRTASSDRPHTPSRISASPTPTSPSPSSATQQPPGSVASRRRRRTWDASGSPGGGTGSCNRRARSWNAASLTRSAPATSSARTGRTSAIAGTIVPPRARAPSLARTAGGALRLAAALRGGPRGIWQRRPRRGLGRRLRRRLRHLIGRGLRRRRLRRLLDGGGLRPRLGVGPLRDVLAPPRRRAALGRARVGGAPRPAGVELRAGRALVGALGAPLDAAPAVRALRIAPLRRPRPLVAGALLPATADRVRRLAAAALGARRRTVALAPARLRAPGDRQVACRDRLGADRAASRQRR